MYVFEQYSCNVQNLFFFSFQISDINLLSKAALLVLVHAIILMLWESLDPLIISLERELTVVSLFGYFERHVHLFHLELLMSDNTTSGFRN